MPNYQKCMIYKLICDEDPTFLYLGHTTNWNRRKARHKDDCVRKAHRKLYTRIRELGGWENIKMIWIEDYPCNNKREGESREQYWMDILKPNMNMQFAQRNNKEYKKEYYEANKEYHAEKNRRYREANKEAIAEHREANKEKSTMKFECECGGRYTHQNKSHHFKSKMHQAWLLTCH